MAATEIMGESFFKTQSSDSKPDSVLIMEMWLKPGSHRLFPAGGMVTCVNGKVKVFFNEGLPFKHGEYPLLSLVIFLQVNFMLTLLSMI